MIPCATPAIVRAGSWTCSTTRLVSRARRTHREWALQGHAALVAWLMFSSQFALAEVEVDYAKEIKPLLRSRCYGCHGALKQKGRLRLDTVDSILRGGESGPALRRGEPASSLILKRVMAADLAERMPPQHEGEPLAREQVALLERWIVSGAAGPLDERPELDPKEHWAFRARVRPPVPAFANCTWVRNPIDAFLAHHHDVHGLTPQPEAPPRVLLRRLYLDLVGIPPSAEELRIFELDASMDRYERTVERLLDDPRYGERWARHWMDIWRYSDWWGLGGELRNSQKHIWRWRDWIVESLNAGMPYDEMLRLMLAADELHPTDPDKLRATGFLARNYFLFNRDRWLEETVEHVGKGFLGLSLNCAKCHDHKYDPIAQKDFYRMRAFFEPYQARLDVVPGEVDLSRDGLPRAFDAKLDPPTYRYVRGQETNPDKSESLAPGVPALFAFQELAIRPVPLPAAAWQPERQPWVLEAYVEAARRQLRAAEGNCRSVHSKPSTEGEVKLAELALELAKAEVASVESRSQAMRAAWATADAGGSDRNPGLAAAESELATAAIQAERVVRCAKARHTLAAVEARHAKAAPDQKEAIGKELTTAQEGLAKAEKELASPVGASERFTKLIGAKWTTTRFVHPDRDDPTVEFQPQSTGRRTALAAWITDARNPLTARVAVNHLWTRHFGTPLASPVFEFGRRSAPPALPELIDWLASELVDSGWDLRRLHRLIVTSAAYRMSSSLAGAERNLAADPDNRWWWRRAPVRLDAEVVRDSILALAGTLDLTQSGPPIPSSAQADSKRRSLYFSHSNNERNLFLTTFDEAAVNECYQREQSIVPQQALALSNSALVQDAARQIAARIDGRQAGRERNPSGDREFIQRAFQTVLGMPAGDAQVAASLKALQTWRTLSSPTGSPLDADAPRAQLVWALLNHNDFVTLR